ncbi:MAG: mandelate racemase, partial [Gemmatimonadetes bacterium]|nr:mandelate racemase [Gemmatimonadota bacterium]
LEPKVDMALAEATDYMRVNPTYDLGITGAMKVAHAAEGMGMDLEIHAPGPAQRHCMAAVRNANYYELGLVHPKASSTPSPVYTNYSDALDAIDENGHVPVPDGPGLGVEIDWEFVEKHRTGMTNYPE